MALTVGELVGYIKLNDSQWNKTMADARKSLESLGQQTTKHMSSALKAGIATAVAGVGTAVTLGVRRLMGIEDAQAKLRGLGHDAKTVESIMESALASVKGTAFGLDAAATTAASAVAAGIKPGQELTRYLKLTADAATIAGVSMSEMGSIINKVTTSGYALTDNLNQLADRGLPIFQWLQEEYGVTAEQLRKMVSDGKVDAETFRKVIEDNIGGAALESGNTTRGAFANMGAAAARLGAVLIGPVFGDARTFFLSVIDWLDDIAGRAGPYAQQFGEGFRSALSEIAELARSLLVPAFERINEVISVGIDWYKENEQVINDLLAALAPAAGIIIGTATAIHILKTAWMALSAATPLGVILALTTALVYAWQHSEQFRDIVTGAFETLKSFVVPIIEGVIDWIRAFGDSSSETRSWLQETWEQVKEIFMSALQAINTALELFINISTALWNAWGDTIRSVVEIAWDTIRGIISGSLKVIQGVIDVFIGVFTGDWSRAWGGIKNIVSGVWENIKSIFSGAFRALGAIIGGAWNVLSENFAVLWDNLKQWFTSLKESFVGWGSDLIAGLWNGIRQKWESLKSDVVGFFSNIGDTVKNVFGIASPSKLMEQYGAFIAEGLAQGMEKSKERVKSATDAMIEVIDGTARRMISSINLDLQISKAEFDVWASTLGEVAVDAAKKLEAELELLNVEMKASQDRLAVLQQAYEDMVRVKGEAAEESRKLYLELLNEQKAQADLAKQIAETNRVQKERATSTRDLFSMAESAMRSGLDPSVVGDWLGPQLGLSKVPEFDTGGIVPGPIGKPQVAIVHGGETILPTHKRGAMGVSSDYSLATTLVRELRQIIQSLPRGDMHFHGVDDARAIRRELDLFQRELDLQWGLA